MPRKALILRIVLALCVLLRDDMNWPFGYGRPLTIESFKLGATLTF